MQWGNTHAWGRRQKKAGVKWCGEKELEIGQIIAEWWAGSGRAAYARERRSSDGQPLATTYHISAVLSIQKQYFGKSGSPKRYSYRCDLCRNTPPINASFYRQASPLKSIALSQSVAGHGATRLSKIFNFRVHQGIIVSGRLIDRPGFGGCSPLWKLRHEM